jgi:hypothetical protein
MGEYVKIRGTETKIGTCESLYYTTFQAFSKEFKYMKKCDGGDTPTNYLTSGEYRFRFPFPDEDSIEIGDHKDFNRGFLVQLSRNNPDVETLFPRADAEWPKITGRLTSDYQPSLSAYAEGKNPNQGGDIVSIEIVAQKPLKNGTLAIVWRDPYSGNMCRIENPEEAILLCRAILKTVNLKYGSQEQGKFIIELCKRISQGYGVSFDNPNEDRINSMVEGWKQEGRAFSKVYNNDNDFFTRIGTPLSAIGITSQTGDDLVYYNTDLYASDSDALKKKISAKVETAG